MRDRVFFSPLSLSLYSRPQCGTAHAGVVPFGARPNRNWLLTKPEPVRSRVCVCTRPRPPELPLHYCIPRGAPGGLLRVVYSIIYVLLYYGRGRSAIPRRITGKGYSSNARALCVRVYVPWPWRSLAEWDFIE